MKNAQGTAFLVLPNTHWLLGTMFCKIVEGFALIMSHGGSSLSVDTFKGWLLGTIFCKTVEGAVLHIEGGA
ncbi:MAG: hypothetical protein ACJAUV_001304 [Flavobacteriales bacterium]|jgi:hypothetical protein